MSKQKVIDRVYSFYENWVIPPQNESLLELKRREFKEKTKYLNPKILYTLSAEEKKDLRDQGYYVDINEKTIKELKNFRIRWNRHEGKYNIQTPNYNTALYQTKYYYSDQKIYNFMGDPDFYNKLWKMRSRIKPYIGWGIVGYGYLYLWYYIGLQQHQAARNTILKIKKIQNNET
jgi:hypothetical protein